MAGGMAEIRLPFHLSVEVNTIYHELEFTRAGIASNGALTSVSPAPVVTWEFPVLAKFRFSRPRVKPFIEAGPTFRTAGNLNGASPSHYGASAGIGVESPLWKLRVAPQIRYSHWARDQDVTYFAPSTVRDQADFLLSISF
jgi:hypothetical protein